MKGMIRETGADEHRHPDAFQNRRLRSIPFVSFRACADLLPKIAPKPQIPEPPKAEEADVGWSLPPPSYEPVSSRDVVAASARQPTLDDVFLNLTGRSLRDGGDA